MNLPKLMLSRHKKETGYELAHAINLHDNYIHLHEMKNKAKTDDHRIRPYYYKTGRMSHTDPFATWLSYEQHITSKVRRNIMFNCSDPLKLNTDQMETDDSE